jgi:tRNA pseudouridine55 synthase
MEGKPLYEYARSGTPLPQPIQARPAKVHSLELVDWIEGKPNDAGSSSEAGDTAPRRPGHTFKWPAKVLGTKELEELDKVRRLVREAAPEEVKPEIPPLDPAATPATQSEPQIPPVFTLTMTVSSGTYVRSIVHDIGLAVGSAAHVVVLTRTRQGEFALEKGNYVAWDLFEKAMEARKEGGEVVRDEDGREDWERAVLDKWQSVDSLNKVD